MKDDKIVELIQMADVALTKAAQLEEKEANLNQKIAEVIPSVTKALIDGKRIEAKEAEAISNALKDPLKALRIIEKLANHRNTDEVQNQLGKPTKSSNAKGSHNTGFANRRPVGETEAGKAFLTRIMGQRS